MAQQAVAKTAFRPLRNAVTGRLLVPHVEIADSPLKRAIGLMGRKRLEAGSGLWIAPCNGVHTLFMRFPIDVVYLDKNGVVLRVVPHLKPFRIAPPVRGCHVMLELPADVSASLPIAAGDRLEIVGN